MRWLRAAKNSYSHANLKNEWFLTIWVIATKEAHYIKHHRFTYIYHNFGYFFLLCNRMRFSKSVLTPSVKLPYKKDKHVGWLWLDTMAVSIDCRALSDKFHNLSIHIFYYFSFRSCWAFSSIRFICKLYFLGKA